MDPLDPGPQPAGRSPAPGRLGAAQAFGNAFWDVAAGGRDAWSDVDGYRAWLSARGWDCRAVGETERLQALDVREALRGLARRNHEGLPPTGPALRVLDAAACRAPVVVRFDPAPRHQPVGDGHEGALGLVLGIVAEAMADGTWSRLKACPGPHCGWMFWDGSRNRSSQWCSMRVCGNRVKGQAFRARRRGAAPA